MIHIEGMGVLGCLLAEELEHRGEAFTWSDNDDPFSAWHCSTGAVYPDADLTGLHLWRAQLAAGRHVDYAAEAPYVFAHKGPPHGGKYDVLDLGALRVAAETAVAVNVPLMVTSTRERFAYYRSEGAAEGDTCIVAHTTADRSAGYLWGWAARVTFDAAYSFGAQPMLYAKAHRFNITYAYPIPGTGQWWAGSSLIHQKTPKRRDPDAQVVEWLKNAPELLQISNIWRHGPVEQGWRPRAIGTAGTVHSGGHTFTMPPTPTSGVRHGLLIVEECLRVVGL